MLVIFPWLYTLVYASQTSYFKPNNVLPVVAFVAIGGAWLLERAAGRIDHRAARALGSIAFLLVVAAPGFRYVYTSFVPTCFDVARYRLKQEINQPIPRLIYYEAGIRGRAFPWEGGSPFRFAAEVEVESLDEIPPHWSAGADALLFRARRGAAIEAGPHGALLGDRRRTESVTLEPAFRHAVGPSVTYWHRAWRVRRPSRTGELARCGGAESALGCLAIRPSERVRVGEEVSLTVFLDEELVSSQSEPPSIRVGGSPLPLYATTRSGRRGTVFLSPRFGWPAELPELRFEPGDEASDGGSSTGELGREPARTGVFVEIHRWRTAEATTSSRPGG